MRHGGVVFQAASLCADGLVVARYAKAISGDTITNCKTVNAVSSIRNSGTDDMRYLAATGSTANDQASAPKATPNPIPSLSTLGLFPDLDGR